MSQQGFHNLHNYIDDLIYTGLPSEIHKPYQFLNNPLSELFFKKNFYSYKQHT